MAILLLVVRGILVASVGVVIGSEAAIVLLLLLLLLLLLSLLSLLSLLLLLLLLNGRRAVTLLRMLLLMMAGLLVHPGRVGLVSELVVSVDMRRGHHDGLRSTQYRGSERDMLREK